MKTNKVIDISLSIPSLTKVRFSSYGPKCCWSIKLQDSLKCNVSRKKWMMKCIFGKQINRSFCKLIVSFEVCVARPGQSTQNKFAYLCGICRKTLDEVFCLWINSKRFIQIDSITLGVHSQACPKYRQWQVYDIFEISQEKREGLKWLFACK